MTDLAVDGGLRFNTLPEPTACELWDSRTMPPSQTPGTDQVKRSARGVDDPRRLYDRLSADRGTTMHTSPRHATHVYVHQPVCFGIQAFLRSVS